MLTKTGIDNILKRLMLAGGMTEEVEADISRIRADIDERDSYLRNYGEVYEGDDKEEYEYVGVDLTELKTSEESEWQNKYNAMKQKYIDTFFGGAKEEIVEEQAEDVIEDGEEKSFEDLFKEKEG